MTTTLDKSISLAEFLKLPETKLASEEKASSISRSKGIITSQNKVLLELHWLRWCSQIIPCVLFGLELMMAIASVDYTPKFLSIVVKQVMTRIVKINSQIV